MGTNLYILNVVCFYMSYRLKFIIYIFSIIIFIIDVTIFNYFLCEYLCIIMLLIFAFYLTAYIGLTFHHSVYEFVSHERVLLSCV
jgi:hypothetical protein